ncbi:hypothetical protein [Planctomicrobium sp. SH527]|uniref:hypothetical protein n=1 Tax=Planctomicrobium sp. SH527 TaxID=3448123 RepID=UPI003F5B3681
MKRFAIEGEVKYLGQPVANGSITLEPDTEKGNKGPMSTGVIENSKFLIPAERGVVGGPYRVRITGYGAAKDTSGADVDYGKPLFTNYELVTDLPAKKSTQVFEVTSTKK